MIPQFRPTDSCTKAANELRSRNMHYIEASSHPTSSALVWILISGLGGGTYHRLRGYSANYEFVAKKHPRKIDQIEVSEVYLTVRFLFGSCLRPGSKCSHLLHIPGNDPSHGKNRGYHHTLLAEGGERKETDLELEIFPVNQQSQFAPLFKHHLQAF